MMDINPELAVAASDVLQIAVMIEHRAVGALSAFDQLSAIKIAISECDCTARWWR